MILLNGLKRIVFTLRQSRHNLNLTKRLFEEKLLTFSIGHGNNVNANVERDLSGNHQR